MSALLPLKVYGYVSRTAASRPMVILKGPGGEIVPVWVAPYELDMAQYNPSLKGVPYHAATPALLRELGWEPVRCELTDVEGFHQFAELIFLEKATGHEKRFRYRAEDVLSLVQSLGVELFASTDFVEKSRQMNVTALESSIQDDLRLELEQSGQSYLM